MGGFDYDEGDIHRRYDRARGLPAGTLALWMRTLERHAGRVRPVVDVGCGTGRFTLALARHFAARVYGVDPSSKMLETARAALQEAVDGEGPAGESAAARVEFLQGAAERLPLASGAADLVFLSMVYHHIGDKPRARDEFARVTGPRGRVAVRTATRERADSFLWQRFFPEARELEARRTPSARELVPLFEAGGFRLEAHEVVRQFFASDARQYCEKIGLRGLSSLRAIPDDAFAEGLARLRAHCAARPSGPVREDVDLFVFAKRGDEDASRVFQT